MSAFAGGGASEAPACPAGGHTAKMDSSFESMPHQAEKIYIIILQFEMETAYHFSFYNFHAGVCSNCGVIYRPPPVCNDDRLSLAKPENVLSVPSSTFRCNRVPNSCWAFLRLKIGTSQRITGTCLHKVCSR